MVSLFHTLISTPLYNGLIYLMGVLPFFDAGVIIILFTIIVKLVLLPLSVRASKAQLKMKSSEKDLQIIKDKYKDDKTEQSKKIMEHYKDKGINPFSSIFILIIQLPILIGIYRVFLKSGLPQINMDLLYSFVTPPATIDINMTFLNFVNISEKSIILALLAGITTYFQISLSNPGPTALPSGTGTPQDFSKLMAVQMKYFFPLMMIFIAYTISSAIALYLITSNLFAIGQEIYIKKKYHKSAIVV